MKLLITNLFLILLAVQSFSQEKVYNPKSDASKDLKAAIVEAKSKDKHILAFVGGNWCSWCMLLDKYIKENATVKEYIKTNYVMLKINHSKENKNWDVLQQLEFPNRFGFPVLVVLNEDGKRIHTQNSGYLEEGKGYNEKVVMKFLQGWTKKALDPKLYIK